MGKVVPFRRKRRYRVREIRVAMLVRLFLMIAQLLEGENRRVALRRAFARSAELPLSSKRYDDLFQELAQALFLEGMFQAAEIVGMWIREPAKKRAWQRQIDRSTLH